MGVSHTVQKGVEELLRKRKEVQHSTRRAHILASIQVHEKRKSLIFLKFRCGGLKEPMEAGLFLLFFPTYILFCFYKKEMITHENLCMNTFINILVYFLLGVLHIMPSR